MSDERILTEVKAYKMRLHFTPGIRQLHALLHNRQIPVGMKRLRRLLRSNGIIGYRKRCRIKTTDSSHRMAVAPNRLQRRFKSGRVNAAWCGDITYLPTAEGFVYLASVIDIGSRRLIGWAMDTNMRTSLVCRALGMAIRNRGASLNGTIFHTDRGSQYCSQSFQRLLESHGMLSSMSGLGQCWDNAVGESLWNILKKEVMGARQRFRSIPEAIRETREWIQYYNLERPHSAIAMRSPMAYEAGLLGIKP